MAGGNYPLRPSLTRSALSELNFVEFGGDNTGATQMAAKLASAAAVARRIYLPSGTYLLNGASLPSDTELVGDGDSTIIQMVASASSLFYVDSGSADPANNVRNLTFRKMLLRGTCDTDGFSEHKHLLNLNGVTNVLIEQVTFRGFRGDGFYLGSGLVPNERHNRNVTVRKCVFDGINNANRNGISVIDGDGVTIEDCDFTNITNASMPGAIDLEPNNFAFPIVRRVTIRGNRFTGIGGIGGVINAYIPAVVTAPPRDINIEGNFSLGYTGAGYFFAFNSNRAAVLGGPRNDVRLANNTASGGVRPYLFADGHGVTIDGNTFTDHTSSAFIGLTGTDNRVRDLRSTGNRFIRCGTASKIGLYIYKLDEAKFVDDRFDDCGDGAAGSYAIDFHNGTSSSISFKGLKVTAPTGKTKVAIQKESGHTFAPLTNEFVNCELSSLTNAFQASQSDVLEVAYTPVLAGATTAGAGTYTSAQGWYRRVGKLVTFRVKVVQTAHDGTGQLLVSLPFAPVSGSETPVTLQATGVTSSGGLSSLVTGGVTVNGVAGAVRCYSTGTGTLANLNVPTGAATIWVTGSYMAV